MCSVCITSVGAASAGAAQSGCVWCLPPECPAGADCGSPCSVPARLPRQRCRAFDDPPCVAIVADVTAVFLVSSSLWVTAEPGVVCLRSARGSGCPAGSASDGGHQGSSTGRDTPGAPAQVTETHSPQPVGQIPCLARTAGRQPARGLRRPGEGWPLLTAPGTGPLPPNPACSAVWRPDWRFLPFHSRPGILKQFLSHRGRFSEAKNLRVPRL